MSVESLEQKMYVVCVASADTALDESVQWPELTAQTSRLLVMPKTDKYVAVALSLSYVLY